MKLKCFLTLAITSILSIGTATGCVANSNPTTESNTTANEAIAQNPCAGNPCAGNPCAGNPCAGNPCAGNPCAGKNPCAGNPCAGKNPCASKNPCAGNPCAGKNYQARIYTKNDVAIDGTDPVAYFNESKPVQGSSQYKHQWKGTTWYFSSAENRDLFAQSPEKYAPQYGGYCAFAMANGDLVPIDPEAWSIVDGKLYLNYNQQVKSRWEKDIPGYIAKADQKWSELANN